MRLRWMSAHRGGLQASVLAGVVAALLAGELVTSVIGIRQLYADSGQLARWSDNNSVAAGTVRIYSSLDNPNLQIGRAHV